MFVGIIEKRGLVAIQVFKSPAAVPKIAAGKRRFAQLCKYRDCRLEPIIDGAVMQIVRFQEFLKNQEP